MAGQFYFSMPVQVRFKDIDALGHVNNAVYFTYMEQARISYMITLGLRSNRTEESSFIIAEATCQFKAPVTFGMLLVVKVRVSELCNSSFSMEYSIEDQNTGRVMALGRTVNVVYDYATAQSKPIPPEWRATIEAFEK